MRQPLQPGLSGEPLPPGENVLRLLRASKDGKATEASFTLTEEDKHSVLQSLSVFAQQLTTPHQAITLMEKEKREAYSLYALLEVEAVRSLRPTPESLGVPSLDVVWDPLTPSISCILNLLD